MAATLKQFRAIQDMHRQKWLPTSIHTSWMMIGNCMHSYSRTLSTKREKSCSLLKIPEQLNQEISHRFLLTTGGF